MSRIFSDSDPLIVRIGKAFFWLCSWPFFAPLKYIQDFCWYEDWRWPQRVIKQVPNIISVMRFILAPVLMFFFFRHVYLQDGQAWKWFWLGSILTFTDGLDGPIARELNAESDTGAWLDPAGDKAMFVSLCVGFVVTALLVQPWWVHGVLEFAVGWSLWVEIKLILMAKHTRELMQLWPEGNLEHPRPHPKANSYGKTKFVIQMVAFGAILPIFITWPDFGVLSYWLVLCLSLSRRYADMSLGGHFHDYNRFLSDLRHARNDVPTHLHFRGAA